MQIIEKPIERVEKIWRSPRLTDSEYRLTRYVLRETVSDGELLHHTLTGELVLLSAEEAEALKKLPGKAENVLEPLVAEHFLVPADFDEGKALVQFRQLLRLTEPRPNITGYTILPTTYCNARCFYCFENDVVHTHMSMETADEVLTFIKQHHGDKPIAISWFGGEPLVGWKVIDYISEELKKSDISFNSDMISNGYLFDADMVRRAKDTWAMKSVQITLDGTREVYNRVKSYVSVNDDPYLRVLDNIDALLNAGIKVSVRLNMDKHNHEDLLQLLDDLAPRFSGRNGFGAYCAVLFEDCGCSPIPRNEEDSQALVEWRKLIDQALDEKHLCGKNDRLPHIMYYYCKADSDGSAIIMPDGTLCKCEQHVGVKALGNLKDGWTDMEEINSYRKPKFQEGCSSCVLEPTCYCIERCDTARKCTAYDYELKVEQGRYAMQRAYQNYVNQNKE